VAELVSQFEWYRELTDSSQRIFETGFFVLFKAVLFHKETAEKKGAKKWITI